MSVRDTMATDSRPDARRPTSSGWECLTESELQVTALAAEGLTNRQIGERLFISPRTAETHLAHVYRKLQVSGRAQLAAEAARRTLSPS
jgi:DNA-binding CsgD family transcriptional regulator